MKKIKLTQLGLSLNELLSREQLKKVMGGDGSGGGCGDGSGCTKNSDCGTGERCLVLPGQSSGGCQKVAVGTSCVGDSDCGNNQKCYSYSPPLTGKYCA